MTAGGEVIIYKDKDKNKNQDKTKKPIQLGKRNRKFLKLLLDLLNIQSYSGQEEPVRRYLIPRLTGIGFNVQTDRYGNIMATRGDKPENGYPLLNAHMDSVEGYNVWAGRWRSWKDDDWRGLNKWDEDKQSYTDTDFNKYNWVYPSGTTRSSAYAVPKPEFEYIRHYKASKEPPETPSCKTCKHVFECFGQEILHNVDEIDDLYYEGYIDYDPNDVECKAYIKWYCMTVPPGNKGDSGITETATGIDFEDDLSDVYAQIATFNQYTGKIEGDGVTRPIGGDDKCGIAIALRVATELRDVPMKLLFTVKEEMGCVGIDNMVKHLDYVEWFNDVHYSITIDRRGNDHVLPICCGKRVCSPAFAAWVGKCAMEVNILPVFHDGSVSDTMTLADHVPNAINISAGYHEAHSEDEWVDFIATIRIKQWVANMIKQSNGGV